MASSSSKNKLRSNHSAKDAKQTQPMACWEAIAAGPLLAFHTGCILGSKVYLHGGIDNKDSRVPSNRFYCYDLLSTSWKEISSVGSPSLSHHASVVLQQRYIVLVGGWDGKVRTSDVFVYDTESEEWMEVNVSGFSDQGGLSSHTATVAYSGEIIVIGREGGLHMQRRHGDSYLLKCDISKRTCKYSQYTSSVSSRSGHTANIIGNSLYIIGGRSDSQVERLTGFKPPSVNISSKSILHILSDITSTSPVLTKMPSCRKNHVAISGPDFIFIHGGDTFDGRKREPVGEMFLVRTKPTIQWVCVNGQDVGRAGHVAICDGEKLFIHGGVRDKGHICGDMRELLVKDSP